MKNPQSDPVVTLTLDLGTRTGWALMTGDQIIDSGTELLATDQELQKQRKEGKERTLDMRFARFLKFIESKLGDRVARIVYEDVLFAGSQAQTQLWGSLRAAVWASALRSHHRVYCVPSATLKRFATGNGGALKPEMAMSLSKAEPERFISDSTNGTLRKGCEIIDDNEVDAIWLARYTTSVDRGDQKFLGVYQRKAADQAARRSKRAAAKASQKARKLAKERDSKLSHENFITAIKEMGRCCGVYRKPTKYGRAACPKCGDTVKIQRVSKESVASLDISPAPSHPTATKIQL